ncbi:2-hydroxyacid dehydrogenase [Sodalis ligni]|uniref:Lactate dehydrogenase-like 2-hydroxyacid dehydrogenase n=1 Tax=Sodalis ligni TaxID=2697027 RepID=A0A4R1N9F3_9GAMM|nr:2-hydroxyacid dehydrogenase [Sodalis ligni]TCL03307.1 lactate dehydrogenase-like 2-hydroxyacid dehydrogenase [Sodalis ligni]
MPNAILRVNKVPDALADLVSSHYDLYEYLEMGAEEFNAIANDIQVILASGESTVDAVLINQLPNLRLIAVFGVGYDGVDTHAAFQQQIQVTNTPNVLTDDVADLGMALMLAASRQIFGAQRFIENGEWHGKPYKLTAKVSGRRLGIVGFGRVGHAVAKRAKGFDMPVGYYDKHPADDPECTFFPSIMELADNSDFLMICASGGPDSLKLINHEVLAALGKNGILINIARGSIIDEPALVAAIENGTIAGAGLDVFASEPDVPQALLKRDNVVLTPHIGSATQHTRRAMAELVLGNITAFYAGEPLLTPIGK